jgi:hypothetical protein
MNYDHYVILSHKEGEKTSYWMDMPGVGIVCKSLPNETIDDFAIRARSSIALYMRTRTLIVECPTTVGELIERLTECSPEKKIKQFEIRFEDSGDAYPLLFIKSNNKSEKP